MKNYEQFTIKINKEGLSKQSEEFRNKLFDIMAVLIEERYEKDTIGSNEIEITYSPNNSVAQDIISTYEGQEITEEELDIKLKELNITKDDLIDCSNI